MTIGVLPFEDLKKKVHLNTGFFETSQYTEDAQMFVTSGNHDQAGLSIGNLQYNFGDADRAQEWFKYMIDNHRAIVDAAFGTNTTQRDEFINVINTYTRSARITWADGISALVNGEKRALIEPYKTAFGNMLISVEGKAKYYSMMTTYYWNPSYELFRHLPIKSRAALAGLFDTYVNKGRYYPVNLIQADFDAIDADTTLTEAEKEAQKIYQINYRGNYDNAVNPNLNAWGTIDQVTFWHGDGVDDGRRGCMANQEGVYYGATYDPETQFDINQEPATQEKTGRGAFNINLGTVKVNDLFLGTSPIDALYLGSTLIGGGEIVPYTSTRVPVTQFRTNPGSYAGIGGVSSVDLAVNQPLWIDCQEPFVACRTYYTIDGTTPTTNSTLYTDALKFQISTTLKVLTVSVFGVAAAVKTLTINIPLAANLLSTGLDTLDNWTTANYYDTVQTSLTTEIAMSGQSIKWDNPTGGGAFYLSPSLTNYNITVTPNIDYIISAHFYSNGNGTNAYHAFRIYNNDGSNITQTTQTHTSSTSWKRVYFKFRPTTSTIRIEYLIHNTNVVAYLDNFKLEKAEEGQTYPSAWNAYVPTGYRYLRFDGFGEYYGGAGYNTTRMIEIEVFSGGVNKLRSPSVLSGSTDDAVDSGVEIGSTTPTKITDTTKTITSNTYNIWWSDITLNNNAGNGWVKFDLGSAIVIESIRYWAYTSRSARFKVWGTNNLADFGANGAVTGGATLLWDMSTNNGTYVCGATAGTNNYHEKVF
jgi:hypothetical protein